MGGRGASGTAKIPSSGMNNKTAKETQREADYKKAEALYNELADRQYPSGKSQVPEKYKAVYRRAKRFLKDVLENSKDNKPVTIGGGFSTDEFSDLNNRVLNSLQSLVRKDARELAMDIRLNVRNIGSVDREIAVLKSLDLTIQDRRKLLKKINNGEW